MTLSPCLRTFNQPAHPQPETGRRGQPEVEGGNHSPREAFSTKLQADFIANQDFLGFWKVDIRWEGRSQRSAPQKRHKAHLRRHAIAHPEHQVAGMGEAISHSLQLGVTALSKHLVT